MIPPQQEGGVWFARTIHSVPLAFDSGVHLEHGPWCQARKRRWNVYRMTGGKTMWTAR
jgi:hypothetical protein